MSDAEPLPLHLPAVAAAATRRWRAGGRDRRGRTASFAEIHARMRAAASAFIACGVRKGDAIAIWAPNQVEWIIAALGAQAAGAVLTPLNTRLKGREAGDILRRSRARLLFTVRISSGPTIRPSSPMKTCRSSAASSPSTMTAPMASLPSSPQGWRRRSPGG